MNPKPFFSPILDSTDEEGKCMTRSIQRCASTCICINIDIDLGSWGEGECIMQFESAEGLFWTEWLALGGRETLHE